MISSTAHTTELAERQAERTRPMNSANQNLPGKPTAPAAFAPAAGSAYPSPIPKPIMEALMPGAKMVAYEFGKATNQMGLLVTNEIMEVVGLCILGAASAAAHTVLRDRNALLTDAEVCKWADTPND